MRPVPSCETLRVWWLASFIFMIAPNSENFMGAGRHASAVSVNLWNPSSLMAGTTHRFMVASNLINYFFEWVSSWQVEDLPRRLAPCCILSWWEWVKKKEKKGQDVSFNIWHEYFAVFHIIVFTFIGVYQIKAWSCAIEWKEDYDSRLRIAS